MKFTRAEIEQAIDDASAAISEARKEIAVQEQALWDLRGQLDGFCRKVCDHGHPCALPRHHKPADRHESSGDRCVFYDGPRP